METWKSSHSDQTLRTSASRPEGQLGAEPIRGKMTISTRSQSRMAPCTAFAASPDKTNPVSWLWFHSTRNLDFCLLALCSCLLAVLCHQVVVIPGSSPAAGSMASSAAMSRSAQLDFLFKAGLFMGKGEPKIEEDSV